MARGVESNHKPQFYALASTAVVLGLLYFGQEVLVPLAVAVLFAFLLASVLTRLDQLPPQPAALRPPAPV